MIVEQIYGQTSRNENWPYEISIYKTPNSYKSWWQFLCDYGTHKNHVNFRFGDELTSRLRRRDDQGDELTCNLIQVYVHVYVD